MKFHPVADIFPKMTSAEFSELRASIKANGVREPVLVADDMIADGRHRWKAAEAEGVDCPTVQYNPSKHGTSLVQYVMDKNLHRRQMTTSQRAMIATNALPILESEAEKREKSGKADPTANLPQGRAPTSAAKAAVAAGVSERSVREAKILKAKAPELAAEVAAGTKSLNAAVKQSKAPPKPEPKKDGLGKPVENQAMREALAVAPKLSEIGRLIDEARRGIEALVGQPIATHLHHQQAILDLQNAKRAVLWAQPYAVCPYMPNCKRGCKVCGGSQWLNKDKFNAVPKDIREAKR